MNGGSSWFTAAQNLPDVPHNSLIIDDLDNDFLYAGNDLGVFFSNDGGLNWQDFNSGLNDATLVMSMTYNQISRKIRIGTHGKGMYERAMVDPSSVGINRILSENPISIYPNPAIDETVINTGGMPVQSIRIVNLNGRVVKEYAQQEISDQFRLDLSNLTSGTYIILSEMEKGQFSNKLIIE